MKRMGATSTLYISLEAIKGEMGEKQMGGRYTC